MNLSSPLRYPGGKAALTALLLAISLLLNLSRVDRGRGCPGSMTNKCQEYSPMVRSRQYTISGSIAEWRRQRDVYRQAARCSRLRRGFATFSLNRCNRSGIIVNGKPMAHLSNSAIGKLALATTKWSCTDDTRVWLNIPSAFKYLGLTALSLWRVSTSKSHFILLIRLTMTKDGRCT